MSLFQSGPNNANGYRIFALINIALFIIGIFLPAITGFSYTTAFFAVEIALAIFTAFTTGVAFNAVFDDDNWKIWVLALTAAINISYPAIFVASHYNQ